MRRSWRWLGAVTAVALGGALLVACGGGGGASLVLYNGQHLQTTQALVSAFEKGTGISVTVRTDDENVLAQQIAAEGANSPADVVFTENSPSLQYLAAKGLLRQVAPSTLANVPARFNSPDGEWVGVSARVSVLVYNRGLLHRADLPTSVLQLADPRFQGKLALAPQETDFQPIVTSVIRDIGRPAALRWLERLKANAAGHIYPDNETVTSDVNSGRAAIGLINQYYWYRLRSEVGAGSMHSALAYLAPGDPGYIVDVSGAGVLRASRHQAAAQRFVAFLTSAEGQRIIAAGNSFEYPIGSGVSGTHHETPLADLRPDALSISQLGDGSEAVALLQEAQLL